jgi:membrane protease subunit (stomatin/prohibitin family)
MFKSKSIVYDFDNNHIISKIPGQNFKKGSTIDNPPGFEAVLLDQDGSQEVIKNTHLIKLNRPVYNIFYVQSNRKIIKAKWGTPTRIKVKTQDGYQNLGGYGHIEFQLINPLRYINTRLNNNQYLDEEMLTKMVLSWIPDLFHQIMKDLEPIDSNEESANVLKLKELLQPKLDKVLDEVGVLLKTLNVENLNFQRIEEAA